MAIKIVQLGTDRAPDVGLRIGTVRRPPRGVPKTEYANQNWFDVWLANIAPTAELMKEGQAVQTEKEWGHFVKKYRRELEEPDKRRILDLLAVFSHGTNFSVGCYCEEEKLCHRSVLREVLVEHGAKL